MPEAYIVSARRTAGGRRNGRLAGWHPADLGALVLDTLVADAGVDLRGSLDELQSAALAGDPKTKSAETYRRDAAAAVKYIEAALTKRMTPN